MVTFYFTIALGKVHTNLFRVIVSLGGGPNDRKLSCD